MWKEEVEQVWRELSGEVILEVREWRLQHPKASFKEIEEAVDGSLARARARLLQEVALASEATEVSSEAEGGGSQCPQCSHPLKNRGQHIRNLITNYDQSINLKRSYGVCPACGTGFFPLDEELELEPGGLTPSLAEDIVLLGSWMPFTAGAKLIGHFRKVPVSEATVRRATEKSGQAYVELQTAQVEALEKELPQAPEGSALQQLSVDGAMVPLLHKEWAEVKTLAIGTIGEPVLEGGQWAVHAKDMSYFSRLAEHQSFSRLATVETHRRGTERAGKVCAVVDGAEWQQKFIDLHRPDAVRILDWCHAAEYLARAGQVAFGAGTAAASEWLGVQLHQLKHGDPQQLLTNLRELSKELEATGRANAEALKIVKSSLEYLEKRREQIKYAQFQARGYPIGSGAVESANKLVVEARLKGSGMHWAREHVNPMVALRTIVCSDRWEEAWPQISQRIREKAKERTAVRRPKPSREQPTVEQPSSSRIDIGPTLKRCRSLKSKNGQNESHPNDNRPVPGRRPPAANHPWRRLPVGRTGPPNPIPFPAAKM